MAEVIRMPLLSDTMTEGKIVAWNKKPGDKVKADDVLAEVETDKATMEVNGYVDGTLLYVGVPAGQAAKINQVIAIVGKEGEEFQSLLVGEEVQGKEISENTQQGHAKENSSDSKQQNTKQESVKESDADQTISDVPLPDGAKEIRMPLLSDTMTEGKIVAWNKNVGDAVKADDVLAEVETDKATMEVVGYEEGTLLYVGVPAGEAAKINQIIAIVGKAGTDVSGYIEAQNQDSRSGTQDGGQEKTDDRQQTKNAQHTSARGNEEQETTDKKVQTTNGADGRIKASPLAKKMAAEKGIDIQQINGTGDEGRITKRDVEGFKAPAVNSEKSPAQSIPAKTFVSGEESYTDIPVTQMRKTIARRLGESMYAAPHFYLTMEINMDNAMAARTTINEVSPVKVSFNDMIIKATASALRLHPAVNSSWLGDVIRQNNHIHIGSAIALPEGLIVPVIRFADQKSLSQIAADAKELYAKANDKKIQPADFTGNTFTISNLGMMDIEEFTAIINPPDSCILAIGRIREIVVSRQGIFAATNVMKVTLSCDHRAVDGAVGAAFLQTLKKFLENPVTMLV